MEQKSRMHQLLSDVDVWTEELKNLIQKQLLSLRKSELELVVEAAGHAELIGGTRDILVGVIDITSPKALLDAYEETQKELARARKEEYDRLLAHSRARLKKEPRPSTVSIEISIPLSMLTDPESTAFPQHKITVR
ncbi:hypothetical protein [Streptomyces lincolnensis]|uniref:hypothetical protein n=1 Tax=Streptomyces lincolnensis TaxID=1915 RepID=UPI0037D38032